MYHDRQSQFELFPGSTEPSDKPSQRPFHFKQLDLTLDNLIVLGVIVIISMVISFSLGVEKGNRMARNKIIKVKEQLANGQYHDISASNVQGVSFAATLNNDLTNTLNAGTLTAQVSSPMSRPVAKDPPHISRQEQKGEQPRVGLSPLALENKFTIQVASYKKIEFAQREAENLKANVKVKGQEIFVLPKGSYSILCVGKFAEKSEAQEFIPKLKSRYKDCVLRSL